MTRPMRIFVLTLCITLMTVMFVSGIFIITNEGEAATGVQKHSAELNCNEIVAAYETVDNMLTFFAPEVKAATHWGLIVCAALSKLY